MGGKGSRATSHLVEIIKLVRLAAKVFVEAPEIVLGSRSRVWTLFLFDLGLGRLNALLGLQDVKHVVEVVVIILLTVATCGFSAAEATSGTLAVELSPVIHKIIILLLLCLFGAAHEATESRCTCSSGWLVKVPVIIVVNFLFARGRWR